MDILGRKHAFWHIDRASRSRNETWMRAEESKKKEKKRLTNSEM